MSMNIYVGNLSFETAETELRELFEAYGAVDSVKIIADQFTGRSRGFGFVEMAQHDEGVKAIQELDSNLIFASLNGSNVDRFTLDVQQIFFQADGQLQRMLGFYWKMGFQQNSRLGYIQRSAHPLFNDIFVFIKTNV